MIINYINNHQPEFWVMVGIVLLALELLILGLSTMVLLFAGIGGILTGAMMQFGLIPETWIAGVSSFGITSLIVGVVLWKPLQKLQHAERPIAGHSSDLLNLEFVLADDISKTKTASHSYSGVDWRVELHSSSAEDEIPAGSRVKVVSVDAGIFRVILAI